MIQLELHPCRPPVWAATGHLQTLLGHLLPSPPLPAQGRRFEIDLGDGDRLSCTLLENEPDPALVLYVFHGLGGDAEADYMRRTAIIGARLGANVILANHRGCGHGAGIAARPYHSGRAEDLSAVIARGRHLYPRARHLAIGFSLSGNALLLLLSGARGDTPPDLAIAVNAPIELERAALLLKRGFNRVYDLRFVHRCRSLLEEKRRAGLIDRDYLVPRLATLHDFDDIYTAPAAGFGRREEYYRSCSTHRLLSRIQVPTVILTAKDDPFVDYRDYAAAELSPHVHLRIEEAGGHMGYLTRDRRLLGTHRWLDYALERSIRALTA